MWDRAHELFKRWLAASPQGKLAIKAVTEDDTPRYDGAKYGRVEQAAISLLLNELPKWLQTELILNRQLDSTAVIFRVQSAVQPGGLSEKLPIFSALTTAPSKHISDTVERALLSVPCTFMFSTCCFGYCRTCMSPWTFFNTAFV